MSDTRTPEEIERDIEREREGLTKSIHELQNTFSVDNIVRSVTDNVRNHGGDLGKSVSLAARENPLALAVTGVGLGWLIFGHGPTTDRIATTARRAGDSDVTLGGGRRGSYADTASSGGIGTRSAVPAGEGPNWLSDEDRGPTAMQRARAGWHTSTTAAGERIGAGRRAASDRVHAAGDSVSRGTGRVRDRSSDMAHRLSEGTEHLSEQARERVIIARERAIQASESAGRSIGRGRDRAVDFFEDHPLVGGAIAFAIGAAIAGALPRSRYEDEHFGAESDRLYDEAERIFEEERGKAERVAGAAIDEARNVGREVKEDADTASRRLKDEADTETRGSGSAADAAVDRAEDAAKRVSDAAEAKAREERLGNPNNT